MDIPVGEVRLHVRDSGPARRETPVLLLHGWPDTGDLWRHLTPRLSANGYRTIAPDLRGFGASSKPAELKAYSGKAHVGDVVGLLDRLDIPRVHLVGHDWGAAIAWLTAASAPERVQTLTALSVGHPAALRSAGWRQLEKSWYVLLFQFRGVAERWLSANDFVNLRTWSGHPDAESVVAQLRDPAALTASLAIYRAMMQPETLFDRPVRVPPVSVPTLGVWSRRDLALTERQMTGSAAYVNAPWRYECVEDCGHWIPLEAPQELSGLLLSFLRAY